MVISVLILHGLMLALLSCRLQCACHARNPGSLTCPLAFHARSRLRPLAPGVLGQRPSHTPRQIILHLSSSMPPLCTALALPADAQCFVDCGSALARPETLGT